MRVSGAGILTKPDLVDKGAEDKVLDVVHNLSCPLKKGYMVVRCRGQQDIQECLSLAEALQKERSFFEDHEQFRCAVLCILGQCHRGCLCLPGNLTWEGGYRGCVGV